MKLESIKAPIDANTRLAIFTSELIRRYGFELLRRLKAMPGASPNSREFTDVLCQLGTELPAHFRNEEKIIRSCGMTAAQVQEHLEAHQEIIRQYAELNFEMMSHNLRRVDVLQMIGDWVINHISLHDLLLRDYVLAPP